MGDSRTKRTTAAPVPEHCPSCRTDTHRTDDGECVICAAQASAEAEREQRREREAAERAKLGLAPFHRSVHHARYALEACMDRLVVARRHALTDAQGRMTEDVMDLVHAARKRLDGDSNER